MRQNIIDAKAAIIMAAAGYAAKHLDFDQMAFQIEATLTKLVADTIANESKAGAGK